MCVGLREARTEVWSVVMCVCVVCVCGACVWFNDASITSVPTQKAGVRTIALYMPMMQPIFITRDPDCVKYILKDKFSSYPKGPLIRQNLGSLFGHGLW